MTTTTTVGKTVNVKVTDDESPILSLDYIRRLVKALEAVNTPGGARIALWETHHDTSPREATASWSEP